MQIEQWVVNEHIEGMPDAKRIYKKKVSDLNTSLKPNEMLLKTHYVSVDPYLHGICLDTPIGQHMGADSIMEVIDAGPDATHQAGDFLQGFGGWQSHVISDGEEKLWQTGTFPMIFPKYRKLNPKDYCDEYPITTSLGILGGPGMTAWGTMEKFFDVKAGETVVISGASGTIGQLVGQLSKQLGAHVVGTAGSAEKADYLKTLGFDSVINYKEVNEPEKIQAALKAAAPNGIDKYFDNIGGDFTDAVFSQLALHSKVAICWQWATQVNQEYGGPRILPYIMFPRATIRGIYALEWFTPENWSALINDMGKHIKSGNITYNQNIYEGFDSIPDAYQSLFVNSEMNRGKVLVKL